MLGLLILLEESWDGFSKGLSPGLMLGRLEKCLTYSFNRRLGCEFSILSLNYNFFLSLLFFPRRLAGNDLSFIHPKALSGLKELKVL